MITFIVLLGLAALYNSKTYAGTTTTTTENYDLVALNDLIQNLLKQTTPRPISSTESVKILQTNKDTSPTTAADSTEQLIAQLFKEPDPKATPTYPQLSSSDETSTPSVLSRSAMDSQLTSSPPPVSSTTKPHFTSSNNNGGLLFPLTSYFPQLESFYNPSSNNFQNSKPPVPQQHQLPSVPQKQGHLSFPQQQEFSSVPQQHQLPSFPHQKHQIPPFPQQHEFPSVPQKQEHLSFPQQQEFSSVPQQHQLPSFPHQQHPIPPFPQQYEFPSFPQQHEFPSVPQNHETSPQFHYNPQEIPVPYNPSSFHNQQDWTSPVNSQNEFPYQPPSYIPDEMYPISSPHIPAMQPQSHLPEVYSGPLINYGSVPNAPLNEMPYADSVLPESLPLFNPLQYYGIPSQTVSSYMRTYVPQDQFNPIQFHISQPPLVSLQPPGYMPLQLSQEDIISLSQSSQDPSLSGVPPPFLNPSLHVQTHNKQPNTASFPSNSGKVSETYSSSPFQNSASIPYYRESRTSENSGGSNPMFDGLQLPSYKNLHVI